MPAQEKRMEAMLFDYQTTYRTDFRRRPILPHKPTVYVEKPKCLRIQPAQINYLHTLTSWKTNTPPVPFSLMHKPRNITGTDPTKMRTHFVEPEDTTKKEQAIKTRPRLVMTPALSMDDIEDKQARALLINSMYSTNSARANQEVVVKYFSTKAPLSELPAPSNPITLPPLQPPYVSPEWRMKTVSWDTKQLRTYCDPSKEFWLKQKSPPCKACEETKKIQDYRRRVCQTKLKGQRQIMS